ncbi:hypothetical protein AB0B50_40830 [Streptomyces sp. NPDC041068]|uniref:hypothetical protein n=1 Tax=Streptomyces sp. NPDC041068 TaxID=3155130 RepID=UPI00340901E0
MSPLTAHGRGTATPANLHKKIDILTAPELTSALLLLVDGPAPDVLVDLRNLDFIDGAGLTALATVQLLR